MGKGSARSPFKCLGHRLPDMRVRSAQSLRKQNECMIDGCMTPTGIGPIGCDYKLQEMKIGRGEVRTKK